MDIICIYGGTGIGKRTIGSEVAKLTDFILFHNHLTIDPALVLLPMRGEETFPIINRFRFALLRATAKRGTKGVIVTAGITKEEAPTNGWIQGLKRLNRGENISVKFVHIHADDNERIKRVQGESRKEFTKTRDPEEIKAEIKRHDARSTYQQKRLVNRYHQTESKTNC